MVPEASDVEVEGKGQSFQTRKVHTTRQYKLATARPGTCFVESPFSGSKRKDLVISLTETMTNNRGHLDEGLVARLAS